MIQKILQFINLQQGEEQKEKVLETIKSNISFRGSNLWILASAIVIASVGLNVNSTAVIIGAMLISPLMGPIVGTGFALAIYDSGLLKRSMKNLLIATVVSLTVSACYFFISPFKDSQSEILARTSPNIYDVIIAFFGGLVGIIALTRVEKGNPIPGVAIATALMPPLCTAGFGVATGNLPYFVGAFFLYTINCFFICIATYLIIKYLKYQPVKAKNPRYEKRIRYGISFLVLVMIVPSCYLAYNLFLQKKYNERVERFIDTEFTNNGYAIIFKKSSFQKRPKTLELAFLTKKFTPAEIEKLQQQMARYQIADTKLEIRQDTKDLKGEILNELGNQNKTLSEQDIRIHQLQESLSEYTFDNSKTLKELSILFPEIKQASLGRHMMHQKTDSAQSMIVLLYQLQQPKQKIDTQKMERWLQENLQTKAVKIVKMD
jgi:uncharacterized hydrophobic protein (TIGR00271 family)